jgi:hypothetical protein
MNPAFRVLMWVSGSALPDKSGVPGADVVVCHRAAG